MKLRLPASGVSVVCLLLLLTQGARPSCVILPAAPDTTCRDTSICIKSDPFNLNLLCRPAGGTYYGSPAILGDQFNPVAASVGPNTVWHGFVSGNDTTGRCSFTVTVADTAYPSGAITGVSSVCRGSSHVYSVPEITNASTYAWSFTGAALADSLTPVPSITLAFSGDFSSGNLTVKGMGLLCKNPGKPSGNFFIQVGEQPSVSIRELADSLGFSDTVCREGRISYCTNTDFTDYLWIVTGGRIHGSEQSRSVTVDWDTIPGSGSLSVTVANQSGCQGLSTRSVTIGNERAPSPSAIWLFGYNMLVCSDSTVNSYQWYYENSLIPGATSRYYLADTSNHLRYTVRTCFGDCCNDSDPFTFSGSSGTNKLTAGPLILTPNPVTDRALLKRNGRSVSPGDVFISDQFGRVVLKTAVREDGVIDLATVREGLYFLRYENRQGIPLTTRFIRID